MHFVSVPVVDGAEAEAELNRFLAGHRIIAIDRQLVIDGARSLWAICVSYVERPGSASATLPSASVPTARAANESKRRPTIDYREVLSADEFQLFVRLRTLRKARAEQDGVPVYSVFTNEQLAEMARGKVRSAAELAGVSGVGKARIERYGPEFLALLGDTAVAGMVRYMDDVVAWCSGREQARAIFDGIRGRIAELGLEIRGEGLIQRSACGLSFLGYRVFAGGLRLSRRRRRRYARGRRALEAAYGRGEIDAEGLQVGFDAVLAITAHADAAAWRREELPRRPPPEL
ncbi:MAG: HRDC domain-containing protein [Myxococcales bacterium]|nr:HRDC domain-containing protein [Myxococcales bacterium]